MERRNDVPNLLAMYIRNTSEKYLANCSTMKTIIRESAKLLYKYDGITPTRQEQQESAREHAKYILECVQYSINNR